MVSENQLALNLGQGLIIQVTQRIIEKPAWQCTCSVNFAVILHTCKLCAVSSRLEHSLLNLKSERPNSLLASLATESLSLRGHLSLSLSGVWYWLMEGN